MQQIHVKELASSTVTRARGEQAFKKLEQHLREGPVEIDLDDVELMSTSFLDEIVRQLALLNQTDQVTFVTIDPVTTRRLERIGAIRQAEIYFRRKDEVDRQLLVPKRVEVRATFSPVKVRVTEP